MDVNSSKRAASIVVVALAVAACGAAGGSGGRLGTSAPLAAAKPETFAFRQAIRVNVLRDLPETIRRDLTTILSVDNFTEALRYSLANDEMLAPEDAPAEYELTTWFIDLRTAPVSDGVTAAQVIFHYRVTRTDNGSVVLDRRIKTEFTSIADPEFAQAGFLGRTSHLADSGTGSDEAAPSPRQETQGPGPRGETAREVHAARNAVSVNIRRALRQIIAASPERIVLPDAAAGPVTD